MENAQKIQEMMSRRGSLSHSEKAYLINILCDNIDKMIGSYGVICYYCPHSRNDEGHHKCMIPHKSDRSNPATQDEIIDGLYVAYQQEIEYQQNMKEGK